MNRRLVALLVLALIFLAGSPASGSAWAKDDFLDSSDPAPRQELRRVPGWVTLVFKADADASLATIVVLDSSGQNVTTGPLIVEGTNVTTQLKSGLPKGTYSVYYRTTDEFGEPRGGAFQFAYGKGKWTELETDVWKGETSQPTILDDPDPTSEPTPTPSETPYPTPTPTGQATQTVSPTATESPQPSVQGPVDWTGWLIGGAAAVVLVLVAGAGWYAAMRRRSRP